jgi:hypothetical protein
MIGYCNELCRIEVDYISILQSWMYISILQSIVFYEFSFAFTMVNGRKTDLDIKIL